MASCLDSRYGETYQRITYQHRHQIAEKNCAPSIRSPTFFRSGARQATAVFSDRTRGLCSPDAVGITSPALHARECGAPQRYVGRRLQNVLLSPPYQPSTAFSSFRSVHYFLKTSPQAKHPYRTPY